MKNKGQISILTTLIIAGSTILASALGAWATVSQKTTQIDTKVQVIEERENNHYKEVSKQLEDINKKLDQILKK